MRTRLLALAVLVAAAFPLAPARADGPVEEILDSACQVDLCVPPWFVEPLVCPVLASLAPGVPGVVDIDSEGDVHVDGTRYLDCPPFGDPEPGTGSPYVDSVEQLVEDIDGLLQALCEVDLCLWPWWLESMLDPLLCPPLASLSPGVPGVVDIDPEGDVHVGPVLYDCPPYGS